MNLKIPPLALTFVLMIVMSVLSWQLPQYSINIPENNFVAIAIALIGALISVMGVVSFRRVKTTVNPAKPNTTSFLVMNGIYRFSRNPMYLGFLLFLLAWGIYLSHLLALLLFPPGFVFYMNWFQIPLEESALTKKFADDFILYKSKVRRWL